METKIMIGCMGCMPFARLNYDYSVSSSFKDGIWMYECERCNLILTYKSGTRFCHFIKYLPNKLHKDYIIWKLK